MSAVSSPIRVRGEAWLAVWLSGNALASINVVALRQTWLVLGWVTVCGRVNHFGINQPTRPTQPFILTGSINRVPTCPVGVKDVGWQITLCDPSDKWRPVVLR